MYTSNYLDIFRKIKDFLQAAKKLIKDVTK